MSAEEAIETAREACYTPEEQIVTACPDGLSEESAEGEDGTVIVVCRRLGPANPFQTRDGPRPELDETAAGAPRAPDFRRPPCVPSLLTVCFRGLGSVPPPVLMIDLTKLPEPLTPEEAAAVFRVEDGEAPP